MLKRFILKLLTIEVKYTLIPRTYIYLFLRDSKTNPKNIVKFSLNLKSREGGESGPVEYK